MDPSLTYFFPAANPKSAEKVIAFRTSDFERERLEPNFAAPCFEVGNPLKQQADHDAAVNAMTDEQFFRNIKRRLEEELRKDEPAAKKAKTYHDASPAQPNFAPAVNSPAFYPQHDRISSPLSRPPMPPPRPLQRPLQPSPITQMMPTVSQAPGPTRAPVQPVARPLAMASAQRADKVNAGEANGQMNRPVQVQSPHSTSSHGPLRPGARPVAMAHSQRAKLNAGQLTGQVSGPWQQQSRASAPQPRQAQAPTPQPCHAQAPIPQPRQSQAPAPQSRQAQAPTPQPRQSHFPTPQPRHAQAATPQPRQAQAAALQSRQTQPSSSQIPTSKEQIARTTYSSDWSAEDIQELRQWAALQEQAAVPTAVGSANQQFSYHQTMKAPQDQMARCQGQHKLPNPKSRSMQLPNPGLRAMTAQGPPQARVVHTQQTPAQGHHQTRLGHVQQTSAQDPPIPRVGRPQHTPTQASQAMPQMNSWPRVSNEQGFQPTSNGAMQQTPSKGGQSVQRPNSFPRGIRTQDISFAAFRAAQLQQRSRDRNVTPQGAEPGQSAGNTGSRKNTLGKDSQKPETPSPAQRSQQFSSENVDPADDNLFADLRQKEAEIAVLQYRIRQRNKVASAFQTPLQQQATLPGQTHFSTSGGSRDSQSTSSGSFGSSTSSARDSQGSNHASPSESGMRGSFDWSQRPQQQLERARNWYLSMPEITSRHQLQQDYSKAVVDTTSTMSMLSSRAPSTAPSHTDQEADPQVRPLPRGQHLDFRPPTNISDCADAIKALPTVTMKNSVKLPSRSALKDFEFRGERHFGKSTGNLLKGSKLIEYVGHLQLFDEMTWQYLIGWNKATKEFYGA